MVTSHALRYRRGSGCCRIDTDAILREIVTVYGRLCPCRDVLDLIANKWSALIIGILENGPQRFGAIQRHLEGVTPKVLSATLKRLEGSRLVDRTVYPAVPPHVEYSLTPLGETLVVPLAALRTWAEEHLDDISPQAAC